MNRPGPTAKADWLLRRLAENNDESAAAALMYAQGQGVLKDEVEGLAWMNLGAISGEEISVRNRDEAERRLGPQLTLVANNRSKELLELIEGKNNGLRASTKTRTPSADNIIAPRSTGTGVIVSSSGYILTAAHVIVGAKKLRY